VSAAMLLLLALSPQFRTPDLRVEAGTAAGAELPELADAVARALLASGARVVLGGPASEPCLRCARVAITELGRGRCRIDVTQDRRTTSAAVRFSSDSPLFDRARAIAIQARLLVKWESNQDSRSKEPLERPVARRPKTGDGHSDAAHPDVARSEVTLAPTRELPSLAPEPALPLAPPAALPAPRGSGTDANAATAARELHLAVKDPFEAERSRPTVTKSQPIPLADEATTIRQAEERKPQWPWIPTAIGAAAAAGAGICAALARDRYNALPDQSRSYAQATALKHEGERWQIAAFVASGVAAVGLGVGVVGFATRSGEKLSVAAAASPIPGGGALTIAGDLP
jgi:hypothetical protein